MRGEGSAHDRRAHAPRRLRRTWLRRRRGGHSGDIVGFHADLWYLPKSRVTVAALINYQAGGESADKDRSAENLISDIRALAP